jgi:hypothetical protein
VHPCPEAARAPAQQLQRALGLIDIGSHITRFTTHVASYVYPALVDTGFLCDSHLLVVEGASVAESAVAALGVVEGLDVVEEGGP